MNYNGLTVKNGRLINNRPNGVTGIQEAVQTKKMIRREEKISMMREAMYQADMMSDLQEELDKRRWFQTFRVSSESGLFL